MRRAFTLIEALLVLAIISILTMASFALLNPMKHMAKARNAQRTTDVRTILQGLHQYATDHRGHYPACITSQSQNICVTEDCTGVHLGCSLHQIVGAYLVAIPIDPSGPTGNDSNYNVQMEIDGRITVTAPEAERDKNISATQ